MAVLRVNACVEIGDNCPVNAYSGVEIEIVKAVSRQMHIQPRLIAPDDQLGYGYKVYMG